MNRLAEVEAFIAVVDAGSQLAAARRMNVAVSAINRRPPSTGGHGDLVATQRMFIAEY